MKEWFKPNSFADYLGGLFLMVVFFVGVIVFWKLVVIPNKEAGRPTVLTIPTCEKTEAEYKELVEKGQSVILTKDQWSYAVSGRFVGEKTVIARRGGEIACGYLFVQAQKGKFPLDNRYDSIYINPQGLGGHILRSRSIDLGAEATTTKVLLSLDSVSYLPKVPYNPESQNFEVADWVKLLNAASKIEFNIGLSTLNQGGMINEVIIAYKCWNPTTGDETTDCQLSVEE